ncbi:MAG: YihY/virulence factor BrkB family protein [Deltaproteobacteria bacterium]|nr:YihY/virulence factor BrkB family protein [Deltaproteobacteria bacterium]
MRPRARGLYRVKAIVGSGLSLVWGDVTWLLRRDASLLAAGLSFFALISMAPFIVLAVAIGGAVFGHEAARAELYARVADEVGPEVAGFVTGLAQGATDALGLSIASIIGVILLLWSSSKLFVETRRALHAVWEIPPPVEVKGAILGFLRARAFAAIGTVILGALFLALLASRVALGVLKRAIEGSFLDVSWGVWSALDVVVTLLLTAALVVLVFRVLPDRRPRARAMWVGALATAVVFYVGRWAVGVYVSAGAIGSAYGAAGSIVVFLVWAYWSSLAFLFGARLAHMLDARWPRRVPATATATPS